MPTKLDQARDLLASRLAELDGERDLLVAAIAQIDVAAAKSTSAGPRLARSSPGRGSASKTGTARGTRRKRAPRGKRESQLLSSIEANPGYRVREHAREIGVNRQHLYPILKRLSAEGRIAKKDGRYSIVGP